MKTTHISYVIVITTLAIAYTSCQRAQGDLPYIDVRKNYPVKEVFLTDIADITYVHLCTENSDYLYSGTVFDMTANTIVITNPDIRSSGDIFFFSKDGSPKSRFNRRGNGPREYRNAYQVFYDEDADDVFVLSTSNVMQVYSSAGRHKRDIPLPQGAIIMNEIISFDERSFLCYDENMAAIVSLTSEADDSPTKGYIAPFYLISKVDGTVLDYFELPIAPIFLGIPQDGRRVSAPPNTRVRLISSKEGALLCNPENDTVFLYGKDRSLTPVLHKIPLAGATNPLTYLNNCIDMGNYQFVEVYTVRAGEVYLGDIFSAKHYMRDKRTGDIFQQKLLLPEYTGKEFIIRPVLRRMVYGNKYYFELDLVELKEAYAQNKLSGKLKELVATLKADDNNVYVIAEFK